MSDLERWLKGNDAHLSASLNWLRLRFIQFLQDHLEVSGGNTLEGSASAKVPWWKYQPSKAENAPPKHSKQAVAELAQASEAVASAAASMDPPPALIMLSRCFQLSDFEQQVLLLCAAMELDPQMASFCAQAHGDASRSFPTFALALSLFEEPAWDVISPERPLRYWRLLEIHQPGAQPLTASPLRADERIVNFIKGLNYLDDRLAAFLNPLESEGDVLPPSQAKQVDGILAFLRALNGTGSSLVQLVGSHGSTKHELALQVAGVLGLQVHRLSAEELPQSVADLDQLSRLWRRESLLLPLALYVDASGHVEGHGLTIFLNRMRGLCFLDVREALPRGFQVDVAKPCATEQLELWSKALAGEGKDTPSRLAGQFNLGSAEIHQAIKLARAQDGSFQERIWDACLQGSRPLLDGLAQRLDVKAGWDDLVLPEPETQLLREIVKQVEHRIAVYEEGGFGARMNRGLGISALFAGESGTGKTMAAEVMAKELRLNLYRIDLSAVVNKYIGETEKNLRRLFDAAEDGGAILFFDEADALFGKRSEVKDSHDRYANIEINYLLQRMEAFKGLAILATNQKTALDQAFLRRLRFVVNFPFPGVAERTRMWSHVFPPQTRVEGLDHAVLARINLTGGSIHNIALNAAFLAAADGSNVTMAHVLNAARTELKKLERPVNEIDLRMPRGAA